MGKGGRKAFLFQGKISDILIRCARKSFLFTVTTDRPIGVPDRPTNLAFSNVTSSSVTLTWTSGYDGGAQQQFMIWQDMVVGYMGVYN